MSIITEYQSQLAHNKHHCTTRKLGGNNFGEKKYREKQNRFLKGYFKRQNTEIE